MIPPRGIAIVLLTTVLAGCTGGIGRAIVADGSWDLFDCKQLAVEAKKNADRLRELEKLMTRARQGPGGSVMATVTYEPEYVTTRTKLDDIQKIMTERSCPPQPGAAGSAAAIR